MKRTITAALAPRVFCALILLVATLVAPTGLSATPYVFTEIYVAPNADSSLELPTINNAGTVVFKEGMGTRWIKIGNGGPVSELYTTGGLFQAFGNPSINDSGLVAFVGVVSDSSSPSRIFAGDGGLPTEVVGGSDGTHGIPWLNNAGTIAFIDSGPARGLYTIDADGTGLTLLMSTTALALEDGQILTGQPAINDLEDVVFVTENSAMQTLRKASAGSVQTLYNSSGLINSFSDPDINNNGTMSFIAGLDSGIQEIFVGAGSGAVPVVDTSGSFGSFNSVGINDHDEIAYMASSIVGLGRGIFTGPDLISDQVVVLGDPLSGSTVTSLGFMGQGFNNAGQITFRAHLADGRVGIFRADPLVTSMPISEPTTLAIFAFGLISLGFMRCRRGELSGGRA